MGWLRTPLFLGIFLSCATFAACLFVALNQSVSIERRQITDADRILLNQDAPEPAKVGPVVELDNGKLQGKVLNARNGREFSAFYQIPFAEPPLGKLRFQPPRPYKEQWDGIRDASVNNEGADSGCVQYVVGLNMRGSEDCLKLNVFTPQLPSEKNPEPKLPVMFYIFGGNWKFGQASKYKADYFMDEDVVLVMPDFRGGPFGHLNTEDMEIRGNQALKDQRMALKWVQENIAKFGGDPNRVLIFGCSSGGTYVSAHVVSRASDGLFHAAISQSGTFFLDIGYNTPPRESARQFGELMNCSDPGNSTALHECLIQANATEMAIKFEEVHDFHIFTKEFIPEDGDLSDTFFVDYPINLLANGSFQKLPWLVGDTNAEGWTYAQPILTSQWSVAGMNFRWNELAPATFKFNDTEDHKYARAIRRLYFGSKPVSNETRYELTDLMSDMIFINKVRQAADMFAKNGGTVYYYYITHEPVSSFNDILKVGFSPPFGCWHADEVQYLFPWVPETGFDLPYIDKNSKDYLASRNLIKTWTSFARDGVPSAPGVNEWLPLDSTDPRKTKWMEMNDECKLIDPLTRRMKLLEAIPFILPLH